MTKYTFDFNQLIYIMSYIYNQTCNYTSMLSSKNIEIVNYSTIDISKRMQDLNISEYDVQK